MCLGPATMIRLWIEMDVTAAMVRVLALLAHPPAGPDGDFGGLSSGPHFGGLGGTTGWRRRPLLTVSPAMP